MRTSQGGFTLIELLVTVAIAGVIGGGITQALILGLRTTGKAGDRLGESTDEQLVTSWFYSDVQSAQTLTRSGTDAACGGAHVLRVTWDDAGTANIATYVYREDPAGAGPTAPKQLVRVHCTVSSLGTTVDDQLVLAGSLSRTTGPTATCQPVSATTTTTSPTSGVCTSKPAVATLTITESDNVVFSTTASTRSTP